MIICSMGRERKLLIGHLKDEVCIAYIPVTDDQIWKNFLLNNNQI